MKVEVTEEKIYNIAKEISLRQHEMDEVAWNILEPEEIAEILFEAFDIIPKKDLQYQPTELEIKDALILVQKQKGKET